jgi:hypothetical protein
MRKSILAFIGVALFAYQGRSEIVIYSDAVSTIKAEWVHGGSFGFSTTDGSEGTKCIDLSLNGSGDAALRSLAPAYNGWIPAKQFKFFQFSVKANNPADISKAEITYWCIHCAPDGGDAYFPERDTFSVTNAWRVVSMPLSIWAKNKLDSISCIMVYFNAKSGTHLYLDDIKFTNTEIVGVRPAAQERTPGSAGRILFSQAGKVKCDIYTLSGAMVSSRVVAVAANTVYQPSQLSAPALPAGAYVVRQSVLSGATGTKLADRMVVVKN